MFILRSTSAHAKIDNATKVFLHDFIVQFAVRLERVVLRQPPWELEVAICDFKIERDLEPVASCDWFGSLEIANCDLKDAFSSAVSAAQRNVVSEK